MISAVLRLKFPPAIEGPPILGYAYCSPWQGSLPGITRHGLPGFRLPCGLLHVPHHDAPAGARALNLGEVHPELLGLAPGRGGRLDPGGVFGALVACPLGRVLPRGAAFRVRWAVRRVPSP